MTELPLDDDATLEIYTDGASRGNPGPASYGFVFTDGDHVLYEESEFLGTRTNNQAEYHAVLNAIERAREMHDGPLRVHSDSKLLVNQLNGEWKVKDRELRQLYDAVQKAMEGVSVRFSHHTRDNEFVTVADQLCNDTLDREGH